MLKFLMMTATAVALWFVPWQVTYASHGAFGDVYYNGQLVDGSSSSGTLNTAADSLTNPGYDFWVVDVTAGVPVSITAVRGSTGNLLPNLVVFPTTTSDGSPVSNLGTRVPGTSTSNSSSLQVTVGFTPNFTGLGTVVVSTWTGQSGSYELVATGINDPAEPNEPPAAIAGAGLDSLNFYSVECDGPDGALVTLDGSGSFDPDGDSLEFEWSAASSVIIDDEAASVTFGSFHLGTHEVTLTVYDLDENGDRHGTFDVAYVTVEVFDDTPPVIGVFSTDIGTLWPPNNKMVPVTIFLEASDHCVDPENLVVLCELSSSQPDDSDGTGEHVGDVDGMDGFAAPVLAELDHVGNGVYEATVLLRAERDGSDKAGRTYSISSCVIDAAGNIVCADTAVVVPHSQGKKK